MWLPCLKFVLVSLLALMPSVLSVVLLWYFEALDQGGPLVLMLLVPALGWYVIHMIRITQNSGQLMQRSSQSDPPPKYEKVIADPPPYEVLYFEKPPATCSCSSRSHVTFSDNKTWEKQRLETAPVDYDLCDLDIPTDSTANLNGVSSDSDTSTNSPTHPNNGGGRLLTSVSVRVEEEPLIAKDIEIVTISHDHDDEGHDPDLPSYQEAVGIGLLA
ncbi:uncharacterized protein [Palaemon carinicauda]|uniref:uncharacterized protein n=1 Tax=Palaemon carinicauda TaxID=392227 RepID=UPI0035B5BFD4